MTLEPQRETPISREIPVVNGIRPLIVDNDCVLLVQWRDLRTKERKPQKEPTLPWELPLLRVEGADLSSEIIAAEIKRRLDLEVEVGAIIKEEGKPIPGRFLQTRFQTVIPVCQYKKGVVHLSLEGYQAFKWVKLDEVLNWPLVSETEARLKKYLSLQKKNSND